MDCPPKWERVGNALANYRDELLTEQTLTGLAMLAGRMRELGFEKGLPDLCERERKSRAAVTLAAYQMSRATGPLGLDGYHAMWLVLRLVCASDFLGQAFPPLAKNGPVQEMGSDWNEEQALAWCLTELWERRADSWLKLTAMEWIGPFPFYGIEEMEDWQ